MAKDKLRYVKGYCELEDGIVRFVGGMGGVSNSQCWYYIIYAIRDRFPKIDYWIDPKMEECHTLPPTMNHLRYGVCKSLKCTFEPFPNGEIRPKKKLSELDRNKYNEGRAKVNSDFIPVLEFEPANEPPLFEDVIEKANSQKKTRRMTFDLNEGKDIDKTLVSKVNVEGSKTMDDYVNSLRKLVRISLEVFNGSKSVEDYEAESSKEIEKLDELAVLIENSNIVLIRKGRRSLFQKTRFCANKIAGWSNRASSEEIDNTLAGTSIALLRLSNTVNVEEGVSGVRL